MHIIIFPLSRHKLFLIGFAILLLIRLLFLLYNDSVVPFSSFTSPSSRIVCGVALCSSLEFSIYYYFNYFTHSEPSRELQIVFSPQSTYSFYEDTVNNPDLPWIWCILRVSMTVVSVHILS